MKKYFQTYKEFVLEGVSYDKTDGGFVFKFDYDNDNISDIIELKKMEL